MTAIQASAGKGFVLLAIACLIGTFSAVSCNAQPHNATALVRPLTGAPAGDESKIVGPASFDVIDGVSFMFFIKECILSVEFSMVHALLGWSLHCFTS